MHLERRTKMRKLKKALSLVVGMMLLVGTITGCAPKITSGTAQVELNSLEKIKNAGELRVGLDDAYPPMGFHDPTTNELVGFDIDFANEIAKRMGIKATFVPTEWKGVFIALNAGKFDTIINGLSVTEERKKTIDFSEAYMEDAQWIITRKDSTINSTKDLDGKIVGVQMGSSSEKSVAEGEQTLYGIKEIKKYDNNPLALADLKAGRLDAVVVGKIVWFYYEKNAAKDFKVAAEKLNTEPYAIGYRKGDKELQEEINRIVEEMKKDGSLKAISDKWFGEDIIEY